MLAAKAFIVVLAVCCLIGCVSKPTKPGWYWYRSKTRPIADY